MRHHLSVLAMLLVVPIAARAQVVPPGPPPTPQPPQAPASAQPPASPVGVLEFGMRGNTSEGDPARFQHYLDLRDGPVLDLFRYDRDTGSQLFNLHAENVGYRSQRYVAAYNRPGRVQANFEWNQIPSFYSVDTRTAYTEDTTGVFRLTDALQAAVQSGATTIAAAGRAAVQFDTVQRRDIGRGGFRYEMSRNAQFTVTVSSTHKVGEQPWGAGFAFAAAEQVPLPLDQRTTDVNAGLEWANARGLLRIAYDGSLFSNGVQSIVFDNPLRVVDAPDGPSQGRMSVWPGSSANTISGMGSIQLPARSRAHAYVSLGSWNQDGSLLPHTINTALPVIPLDRPTAQAEARVIAVNAGLNSRPTNTLWLNARFRLYDYDNRTPRFNQPQYVRADSTVAPSVVGGSEPFGYTRNFADLDASFTPFRAVAFRVGYGREHDDRTFRFLDQTTEHTVRASIDSTGLSAVSVRGVYEYSHRIGDGFDEEAFSDIGEQVSLRQFDISNRNRHRVSAIVQVAPVTAVGVTAQLGVGLEERPDASFGLQNNDQHFFNVALDYTPAADVLVGVGYGRETYSTFQKARQANPGPQFNDPTRDWTTDMDEHVDTITASLDLPRVLPRTGLHVAYDFNRSNARYVYGLAPNSTLAPPDQLTPVRNVLHRGRAEVVHDLTRRLGVGVTYWFDQYSVDDFAYAALTPPLAYPGSGVFLGYVYRDYTSHTAWARLIVRW